jgi:hypothetical protein
VLFADRPLMAANGRLTDPLTSSVNGRRSRCRLRINNRAGRRWRHNCRSGRRLYHPLFLEATRSQRGNADEGGNKEKRFHDGAPDFMTALPVEGFVDNDEEVLRLHGSPRTEAPYGCFARYSRTASVASVHKANATS